MALSGNISPLSASFFNPHYLTLINHKLHNYEVTNGNQLLVIKIML